MLPKIKSVYWLSRLSSGMTTSPDAPVQGAVPGRSAFHSKEASAPEP